ncbi:hypothetical protein [Methylibium sp.]|uniref:hypothetical protein n=1 Tax=Methylibium sp. TaxID=2067992 RepID=UPI003D0BE97B
MNAGATARLGLRLLLALGLWLAVAVRWGPGLTAAFLPVLHWEIARLDGSFEVVDLAQAQVGPDRAIRLIAVLRKTLLVGEHVVLPDPRRRARVSTPAGHLLQPWVLGLALICAWPLPQGGFGAKLVAASARGAAGVALLALATLFDLPLLLLAELHDLYEYAVAPDSLSPGMAWAQFLEGGGRLTLGLAAGLTAIGLGAAAARLREARTRSRRP